MSVLDFHRRKRFISAVTSDMNIGYQERQGITPHTDGKNVIMPPYNSSFTPEEESNWMFSLLHECYHNLPENRADFDIIKDKNIDMRSPFGFVLNIVIDHNIENKRHGIFQGADDWMEKSYSYNYKKWLDGDKISEFPDIIQAAFAFDQYARTHWLLPSEYSFVNKISSKAKTMYEKLVNNTQLLDDYLMGRLGGEPNYELTKRLIDESGEDSEQMEQEAQGNGSGTGNGGDAETSKGKKGKTSEGEGKQTGESTEGECDYSELTPHSPEKMNNEGGNGLKINYEEEDFFHSSPYHEGEMKIVMPSMDRGINIHAASLMSVGLSTRIRNILKVYSQARYQGGKTKGKINKRAVAKVTTGYDKIWRQKEYKDVLDTVVTVLTDCSGSMNGEKYFHASAACAMLTDCLTKLNVPHNIIGFSDNFSDNPVSFIFKEFNDKVNSDIILTRMNSSNIGRNSNLDGESINYAHDLLIQQKQKRKILIVLSDGQPAGKNGIPGYTCNIVKEIEDKSPVEIYGIGIKSKAVKDIYTNYKILNESNQLESTLLETIKAFMIK